MLTTSMMLTRPQNECASHHLDAMNSPQLFEPWYHGPSWDRWKIVLKAAHGLPLNDEELAFFHEVAGARDPPKRKVRELWAVCGRGAGKDAVASGIIALPCRNVRLFNAPTRRANGHKLFSGR